MIGSASRNFPWVDWKTCKLGEIFGVELKNYFMVLVVFELKFGFSINMLYECLLRGYLDSFAARKFIEPSHFNSSCFIFNIQEILGNMKMNSEKRSSNVSNDNCRCTYF